MTTKNDTAKLHEIGFAQYRELPELNFSVAKYIKDCPRKMRSVQQHGIKTTTAMELGTAVHTAVLEPNLFKRQYKQGLAAVRRGTKAWNEHAEKFPKAITLKHAEYREVTDMRDSVMSNVDAKNLLNTPQSKGGFTESSMTWVDETTGLDLKCRIDKMIVGDDDHVIIDLKTTADASPRAMSNRMVQAPFHYLLQMAWYQRGFEAVFGEKPRAVIVAIEKSVGYPTAVYDIAPTDMDFAQAEISEMLDMITTAYDEDGEGHYHRQMLDLPKWWYLDSTEEDNI